MISKTTFNFLRQYFATTQQEYLLSKVQEKTHLYIYKKGFQQIVVRFPHPRKKIFGYAFQIAEVFFKLHDSSQNDKVDKWVKQNLQFQGELIMGKMQIFSKYFSQAAIEYLQQYSQNFKQWLKADIQQVFILKEKECSSFGYQNGYMMIDSIYKRKIHRYFEYQSWYCQQKLDEKFQHLIKIQQLENNVNYPVLFKKIIQELQNQTNVVYFIKKIPLKNIYEIKKEEIKQKKKQKQLQNRRQQLLKYFAEELW